MQRVSSWSVAVALCFGPSVVGATPSHQGEVRAAASEYRPPQPFVNLELLRADYRALSPVTERSVLVNPAAPLPLPRGTTGAILFQYRNDVLAGDLDLNAPSELHRFELGLPTTFRWSDRVDVDVDLRAIYAGPVEQHLSSGWYPSVRVGPTYRLTDELAFGGSIFWSRGGLGFIPVPLGTLYWRPKHGRFRVDALVPRYIEASVRLATGIQAFSTFHWESLVWAVPRDGGRSTFLLRQEVRLQAGLRFSFLGPLGIEASTQWVPVQVANLDDAPVQTFLRGDDFVATVSIVLDRLWARPGR